MDDRAGPEPAQPPDPREPSGDDAPPPRGFSFPSATDAAGSPAPHAPTFSLPDDTHPTSGRYGRPATAPHYGGSQGQDYSAPGTPGFGTPSPVAYPNPGYEPPAMPIGGGHGQPTGSGLGESIPPPGYGQPPASGGYGQAPPPAPTSGGYPNPWGPQNAGPAGPAPGYGRRTTAAGHGYGAGPGYGAPVGDAHAGWSYSGPIGFAGQPAAGSGNQPSGPKDQQALVAMVVGLSSTVLALAGCCYLAPRIVALLAGAAAVVLGILAQQRISKSAGRLTGTPQAAIGIASGAVAIFLALLVALVTLLN